MCEVEDFEVGDIVVCIENGGLIHLTEYKLYSILQIIDKMVYIKADNNSTQGYFPYRFSAYDYRKEKILKLKERIDGSR